MSHGYHMVVISHGCHMVVMGCHMDITWLLWSGTWMSHGYHMFYMMSHGYHMVDGM